MTYAVSIVELPRQPTLVTRFTTRPEQLGERFLADLPRVLDVALAQRCRLGGAPFARYLGHTGSDLHMEIGLILAADAQSQGDVLADALPGGPAARTIHIGDYMALGDAHTALRRWSTANGRTATHPIFEHYVSDPSESDDPATWRTEVYLPLA